ncbi:alkene reductase [Gemmatimonadetes bacterium T265]|nr:alkene reductase [Gemmatimonadetes bacterium T265]
MTPTLTESPLFTPFTLGRLTLPNRIVLAPMTRVRASAEGVIPEMAAEYYARRASGGLLITEATQVLPNGAGGRGTPGIHDDAQIAAWRRVTDAVHAAGGRIYLQLWHTGRAAHPSFLPEGEDVVSASAVAIDGEVFTPAGRVPYAPPRALTLEEIPRYVEAYARGARNAIAAGFDGVEIHAANGYLIDQFLRDGSNRRTDAYGGSVENRARFLLDVVRAVAAAVGADRTGVRVSPTNPFQSMRDADPAALFGHVARELNAFGLAYLHVLEPVHADHPSADPGGRVVAPMIRAAFRGPLILNGGYDRATADAAIAEGRADLIAFGVPYLANPDLPERYAQGAPLNPPNPATFYGGGAEGYLDYPTLAEQDGALAGAGAA